MGNSASSKDASLYGGVFLKMNDKVLIPGATASGTIYLDLTKDYPGNKLYLTITGSEYTKWIDRQALKRKRKGQWETYYKNTTRSSTSQIANNETELYHWKQGPTIPKGQYIFPFQFLVPRGLPSSFFFRRGTAIAQIKYYVEGYLKADKKSIPRLSHKSAVLVQENSNTPIAGRELSTDTVLKTWDCLAQGTVSVKTAFEKSTYATGEEARIITEIDNSKCALPISNVRYTLLQKVTLNAQGFTRTYDLRIRSTDLGRVDPGQAKKGNSKLEASFFLPPTLEAGPNDLDVQPDDAYFPNPSSAISPSTHGKIITSDFSLVMICDVEGCLCCQSSPSNTLPVFVYSADLLTQPDPVMPQNWQPQQMSVINAPVSVAQPVYAVQQAPLMQQMSMVSTQMPQDIHQPQQASSVLNQSQQMPITNVSGSPMQPMNVGQEAPIQHQMNMVSSQTSPGFNQPQLAPLINMTYQLQVSPHLDQPGQVMYQPHPTLQQQQVQGIQTYQTFQQPQYIVQPYAVGQPQYVQVVNPYPNQGQGQYYGH